MYKPYCNDGRLYLKFLAKYKKTNETMKDIYDVNPHDTLTIGGVGKSTNTK